MLWLLQLLLLSTLYCYCWTATTPTPTPTNAAVDDLDVRLRFQGKDLVLNFPASTNDAMVMARKFCMEKLASAKGSDQLKDCIRSIGDYLIAEVQKHDNKRLKPSLQDGYEQPTKRHDLHYEVDSKGVLTLTLQIQGRDFPIKYDLRRDRPIEVARKFCINHMKQLSITKDTMDTCVLPVEKSLREAELEHKTQPKGTTVDIAVDSEVEGDLLHQKVKKPSNVVGKLKITLHIGGYNYEVNYDPQTEKASTAAMVFCRQNAHIFGITTSTMSTCVDPIVTRLTEVEQEERKKLTSAKKKEL